jgi:hypothetical protein
MVGHYLAEFSISYKPVKHGRPGIGATHSSRFIPLKYRSSWRAGSSGGSCGVLLQNLRQRVCRGQPAPRPTPQQAVLGAAAAPL